MLLKKLKKWKKDKKMKEKRIHMWIGDSLKKRLQAFAKLKNVSFSEVIRLAIEEYLKKHDPFSGV